ncbi:low molecular weight phosphatase family protein [Frigoribacterium sp. CFBP9030]|uniref:arsenate reductase/protein-tyrosine-phosphatase family protein n=1 Tax=Frigoribacterium sp. CFBP9030 TaxID=3096537 RepID=UPI002A6A2BF8|nr:low molecular weight phosphatase family protein [Frigoribacterium sp. CFBP9030]MDY0892252.1 low molecular weight phosphatase family protein [Frigoribacterium sp. CFBP9030]
MSLSLEGLFDRPGGDFGILTVCTGNICRSPFAEQYLRAQLAEVPRLTVDSAGTHARDGDRMPAQAVTMARTWGADPDKHSAKFLVETHVAQADLVFGLAREHRRSVVTLHPRASRYTFTLREFARLAAGITDADLGDIARLPLDEVPSRLRELVALVASRRGAVTIPSDLEEEDVVDPYRQSDEVFDESARQLVPASDIIVAILRRAAFITPSEAL